MPLTQQERVRIRMHLGYLNVSAVSTFVLGTPAAVETQFIIEGAMDRVLLEAEGLVRELLGICDTVLAQKVEGLEAMQVDSIGDIAVRKNHQVQLDGEYDKWRGKLADALGVFVNPFEKWSGGGGINVPVS